LDTPLDKFEFDEFIYNKESIIYYNLEKPRINIYNYINKPLLITLVITALNIILYTSPPISSKYNLDNNNY
jgi:hypothetical protein